MASIAAAVLLLQTIRGLGIAQMQQMGVSRGCCESG